MAETIYALCALTSTFCVLLLGRSYLQTRSPMLGWSVLGFAGLAANNLLLLLDLALFTDVDLSIWRTAAGLVGVGLLVIGLIWEER